MNGRLPGAIMGLVGLFACATSAAAAPDCKQKAYASLPVEITEDGAVVLPADVNGHHVYIYLHMSQGIPTIFHGAVDYLRLKPVRQADMAIRFGQDEVKEKVVLDSLRLGGADFTKWTMYVMPERISGDLPQVNGVPVIGALTSAFISRVDLELNLAQKRVNLFEQTRCRMNAVYWGGEVTAADISYDATGLIVFPLEVDGKKVLASFNTAGSASRISELVTDKFFGFNRDSSGVLKETREGDREVASYRAMALTAKGLSLKNVRIQLMDDRKDKCDPRLAGRESAVNSRIVAIGFENCLSRAPMTIGTDLLRKLRIYIASREGKIYFTRADELPQVPLVGP